MISEKIVIKYENNTLQLTVTFKSRHNHNPLKGGTPCSDRYTCLMFTTTSDKTLNRHTIKVRSRKCTSVWHQQNINKNQTYLICRNKQ